MTRFPRSCRQDVESGEVDDRVLTAQLFAGVLLRCINFGYEASI